MMAEESASSEPKSVDPPHTADRPAAIDVAALVRQHHQALCRYAYRLTGSTADAEDLTQQTFLTASRKIEQLRDAGKARSWLFTVLRSCFLKAKRKKVPIPVGSLEFDIEAVPRAAPRGEEIDGERIQAALNELPDEFRLVLVLYYFEERSYKEIAAELDVPLGTVMSRLSRAKSHLRRRLAGPDGTGKENMDVNRPASGKIRTKP